MNYSNLSYFLSEHRLNRYFNACHKSEQKTLELYSLNMQLSQSFYPILNLFEICLRNTINENLSLKFSDTNWLINQKSGFMNDKSLMHSNYRIKKTIIGIEDKIKKSGSKVSNGKIVSELSFGFWTSLFYNNNFKLLEGSILKCFPYKDKTANRAVILEKLEIIRIFRNRVYHNEPFCFKLKSSHIDLIYSMDVVTLINKLISWMDRDLGDYFETFNNTNEVFTLISDFKKNLRS